MIARERFFLCVLREDSLVRTCKYAFTHKRRGGGGELGDRMITQISISFQTQRTGLYTEKWTVANTKQKTGTFPR